MLATMGEMWQTLVAMTTTSKVELVPNRSREALGSPYEAVVGAERQSERCPAEHTVAHMLNEVTLYRLWSKAGGLWDPEVLCDEAKVVTSMSLTRRHDVSRYEILKCWGSRLSLNEYCRRVQQPARTTEDGEQMSVVAVYILPVVSKLPISRAVTALVVQI